MAGTGADWADDTDGKTGILTALGAIGAAAIWLRLRFWLIKLAVACCIKACTGKLLYNEEPRSDFTAAITLFQLPCDLAKSA